jgi:hypothetical protein
MEEQRDPKKGFRGKTWGKKKEREATYKVDW